MGAFCKWVNERGKTSLASNVLNMKRGEREGKWGNVRRGFMEILERRKQNMDFAASQTINETSPPTYSTLVLYLLFTSFSFFKGVDFCGIFYNSGTPPVGR